MFFVDDFEVLILEATPCEQSLEQIIERHYTILGKNSVL